ncbi:MAG TPA: hypothetical protein VI612_03835 [Candidatus Nanoarchaeia archaeon]|nr:hypothetical protein [Candidatus Nanoarchaeia archaeon]
MRVKLELLLIVLLFLAACAEEKIATSVYPIRAIVEDNPKLGITANRSLDFPRIPFNTVVTRHIVLSNFYDFNIKIVPNITGDVTPYVVSSLEPVLLDVGEERKFNVTIAGRELGNYTGALMLDIYRTQ